MGFINVPNGVWIDEQGMLVRPAEPAWPPREPNATRYDQIPEDTPQRLKDMLGEARKIRSDPAGYVAALRDWVELGVDSRYALTPQEVVERSQPRPVEQARAAAAFELGQHLWREGYRDAAVGWFRESHRLHPDNWTYKRQAWTLVTSSWP